MAIKVSKKDYKDIVAEVGPEKLKIEKLNSDKRYKDIFQITKDEFKALESLALSDGEIYEPLFVWKWQAILVYGYHYWEILKANPDIKYIIREIEFQDWQEAQVWAVEHYIAQPETILWQKLEAAINCESYWLLKEDAKKAHGNRSESPSVSEGNSDRSKEVNVIIGQKVGCSATYVYNFKKILSSGKKDTIEKCRSGELSINAAYVKLFPPVSKKTAKPTPQPDTPMKLDIGSGVIFDECEQNIDVGSKKTGRFNGAPVDPDPIAQKIRTATVPDGAIWITLHKKVGQMQVVKKTFDSEKGIIHTKIDSYKCKIIATENDVIIMEADHINGGTEELRQKDDSEFESKSKKAS